MRGLNLIPSVSHHVGSVLLKNVCMSACVLGVMEGRSRMSCWITSFFTGQYPECVVYPDGQPIIFAFVYLAHQEIKSYYKSITSRWTKSDTAYAVCHSISCSEIHHNREDSCDFQFMTTLICFLFLLGCLASLKLVKSSWEL